MLINSIFYPQLSISICTHTHSQPNVREHLAVRTAPVRLSVPSESGWPASVRAHKYRTACSNIFTGCDIDMSRWRSHERARSGPKTHTHTHKTHAHAQTHTRARLGPRRGGVGRFYDRMRVRVRARHGFECEHAGIRVDTSIYHRDSDAPGPSGGIPQPPPGPLARALGRACPLARTHIHTHNVSAASSSSSSSFVCTGRKTRTRCVL